ncbi:hypothetical protein PHET_00118 [Paragonimus heterotremus]|uniref:Uncharacterized protein n=1 Tax=Paragonimus heterotremus TaxID=100268 RepID=A0A8J4TP38_9TREM|nr:hypothetical protein PHET_00118 [Paragonimus heterotremus]
MNGLTSDGLLLDRTSLELLACSPELKAGLMKRANSSMSHFSATRKPRTTHR